MANLINSNALRKGIVFLEGNEVWKVLDYKHIKMGRGQATIRVKVQNIHSGTITEKTFTNEQRVEEADTSKRTVQYLYHDDSNVYLMDSEDFSQFTMPTQSLEDYLGYFSEGQKVIALFLEDEPVSIELPSAVELEVTESPDAVAGDTSGNATKKITLSTGLEIDAPLFIKKGELIRVNTETASYMGRA